MKQGDLKPLETRLFDIFDYKNGWYHWEDRDLRLKNDIVSPNWINRSQDIPVLRGKIRHFGCVVICFLGHIFRKTFLANETPLGGSFLQCFHGGKYPPGYPPLIGYKNEHSLNGILSFFRCVI